MMYGGKEDIYNDYGQNEREEYGNETTEAEPEYDRHIGSHQAPPGYVFQPTQSYTSAPNVFVEGYPAVLPPVMNSYLSTAPAYPQQQGYLIENTVRQSFVPLSPMMNTSQVPGIQSSSYPVQPYTEATETQPETPSQDLPEQATVMHENNWRQLESMFRSRRIVICAFGVTLFVILSIGKSFYLTATQGFVF